MTDEITKELLKKNLRFEPMVVTRRNLEVDIYESNLITGDAHAHIGFGTCNGVMGISECAYTNDVCKGCFRNEHNITKDSGAF